MPNPTAQAHYDTGLTLYKAKEYLKALIEFEKSASLDPQNSDAWWHIGQIRCNQKENKLAADAYAKAIIANPAYDAGYLGLGITLHAMGNLHDAVTAFKKAVELKTKLHHVYYRYSRCLADLGQNEKALEQALICRRMAPTYEPEWITKIETICNHLKTAKSNYKAHWEGSQRDPKNLEAILAEFKKVVALNPNSFNAWWYIGQCYRNVKRQDGTCDLLAAADAYARCIKANPQDVHGFGGLGDTLRLMGNINEAITLYKRAVELVPTYHQMRHSLSQCLAHMGRNDEALLHAKKMAEIAPGYAPDWLTELKEKSDVISEYNSGNYQTALPHFENYAKKHPHHKDIPWYTQQCNARITKP